jgi:hypothetical protein
MSDNSSPRVNEQEESGQQVSGQPPEPAPELVCYLQPGWSPLIRPAPATRPWMDATPEAFAYRCLPLNIANAHGWEILSPCGFEAVWDGGTGIEGVTIRPDPGAMAERLPVSLFGQGVLTFHVEGIFRTPPGWNLWVSGAPNRPKDGIAPLTGIIESDWSPYTFTMNWRFTRPHAAIRFEAFEPFCFLFPVGRTALEAFAPRLEAMATDPALDGRFTAWSRARDDFHERMRRAPPASPADRWQKHYYRGVDVAGTALVDDHQAKLRLKPFDRSGASHVPAPPLDDAAANDAVVHDAVPAVPMSAGKAEVDRVALALAKREWLLETLERQRDLAPELVRIERRGGLRAGEFLERYYAANRPVILTGEMAGWPALGRWTPDYLKAKVGSAPIEFQGGRLANARFEVEKEAHRRQAPFDQFIDLISRPGAGNDAYLTAYNSATNLEALRVLHEDLGFLRKFLSPDAPQPNGMMWIGPAGTVTPLHHDLTNNFIAQLVGRKRFKLMPASEVGRVYNDRHVFSELPNLDGPIDGKRFPRLAGARIAEAVLGPGDIIFMPVGWWHQVTSLDFSVTITYTNFRWPNDASKTYPAA